MALLLEMPRDTLSPLPSPGGHRDMDGLWGFPDLYDFSLIEQDSVNLPSSSSFSYFDIRTQTPAARWNNSNIQPPTDSQEASAALSSDVVAFGGWSEDNNVFSCAGTMSTMPNATNPYGVQSTFTISGSHNVDTSSVMLSYSVTETSIDGLDSPSSDRPVETTLLVSSIPEAIPPTYQASYSIVNTASLLDPLSAEHTAPPNFDVTHHPECPLVCKEYQQQILTQLPFKPENIHAPLGALQSQAWGSSSETSQPSLSIDCSFGSLVSASPVDSLWLDSEFQEGAAAAINSPQSAMTLSAASISEMQSPAEESPVSPIAREPHTTWVVQTNVARQSFSSGVGKKRPHSSIESSYREKTIVDNDGKVVATMGVSGSCQVIRQPYTAEKRRQTRETRQRGACEPCKLAKKRCDRPASPYQCCNNCRLRVVQMPCFLAKIVDVQLFRDKPSPAHPKSSLRQQIFQSLTDIENQRNSVTVTLTQDFGEQLVVRVAEYEPQASEKTYRVWKDRAGNSRKLEVPSFCIADMAEAFQSMLQYIRRFRGAFLRSLLMRSNEITTQIFDQAQRISAFSPDSMVSKALDLCASCRIIERDWRICSEETLGINIVMDDESPWCGTVPITPMMDAQLDQIVIQKFLVSLREKLLQELETKIKNCRREDWFEIFLTNCILLSHAEWLLDHSRRNAIRCGAKTRYNYMPRAEAYFHACRTLIAYFHHVSQGSAPLSIKWASQKASKIALLDQEEMDFMKLLQEKIKSKEKYMLSIRSESQYETELHWTHQLFFPNWKP